MSDLISVPNIYKKFCVNSNYTSQAMNANNTTVSVTLWTLVGVVFIVNLYGIVETTLGSNHTTAFFRLNDGTATPSISTSGATLSSFSDNSTIKHTSVAVAISVNNAGTNPVIRGTGIGGTGLLQGNGTMIGAKDGATTTIEYRYSTTDTPTTGQIGFYLHWIPLSSDGSVS